VTDPLPQTPVEVPTISGACFFMAREDFAALEGFDDGFFLHVEDVDLCWRVRRKGGVVLFHPRARVIHLGSTSQKHPLFIEYWKGLGLSRFFRKRADSPVRKLLAYVVGPVVFAVSLTRPLIRFVLKRPSGEGRTPPPSA
jgi:GT2 family glycosyltransferase